VQEVVLPLARPLAFRETTNSQEAQSKAVDASLDTIIAGHRRFYPNCNAKNCLVVKMCSVTGFRSHVGLSQVERFKQHAREGVPGFILALIGGADDGGGGGVEDDDDDEDEDDDDSECADDDGEIDYAPGNGGSGGGRGDPKQSPRKRKRWLGTMKTNKRQRKTAPNPTESDRSTTESTAQVDMMCDDIDEDELTKTRNVSPSSRVQFFCAFLNHLFSIFVFPLNPSYTSSTQHDSTRPIQHPHRGHTSQSQSC
jgi:hypothetical protein